jgi:hypothetical protein
MPRDYTPVYSAVLSEPSETVEEKIAAGRTHVNALEDSEEWQNAPKVQKAAKGWKKATEDLATQHQRVADLEKLLDIERAHEFALARDWGWSALSTTTAVTDHCVGYPAKILIMGMKQRTYTPREPYGTPENFEARRGKVGTATVAWETHRGDHRKYEVQYAENPDDETTYAEPCLVSVGKFVLAGRTPGETLYFRVRGLDPKLPTGYTAWTAWLAVLVST